MKFSFLIPEELKNVKLVNDELGNVAVSSNSNRAYLVFNFLVLVAGGMCGYLFSEKIDDGFLNAVIAFAGVIVGFVMTAMLFSGRSQYLGKLTYEQTLRYVLKTKYMLMSQINTLFAFLLCLAFSLAAMFSMKSGPFFDKDVFLVAASAYFMLGCYRMMLLPFQIYDVHCFALDNLVEDSAEEVRASVRAASEARREKLARLGR